MQNLGRFYTTSDFDHEYLRNDSGYPKSERYVTEMIAPTFSETRPVNFGPVSIT